MRSKTVVEVRAGIFLNSESWLTLCFNLTLPKAFTHQSSCEMLSLLNIPQWTISGTIGYRNSPTTRKKEKKIDGLIDSAFFFSSSAAAFLIKTSRIKSLKPLHTHCNKRCKVVLLPSTCPVYPGSVAIQFSFHLLLATQFHKGPPVLHPLSLLRKFSEKIKHMKAAVFTHNTDRNVHINEAHLPRQDSQN